MYFLLCFHQHIMWNFAVWIVWKWAVLFSKTFSGKEADWTDSEQLYETETRREWKLWSRIKLIQIVWTPIRLANQLKRSICNEVTILDPNQWVVSLLVQLSRQSVTPDNNSNPPSRGRKIKRVYMQFYNPGVLGWGFLRLLLRLQLRSLSRVVPSSHVEKDGRWILGHIHVFIHESVTRCVTRCLVSRGTVDLISYKE